MLNSIALVGRLTREPEAFTNGKGDTIVNFTLAFSNGLNPDGSENTGFIDCKTFKNVATTCAEWLSKGDKVAVTGRISYRKFTKKDGTNGVAYQILVNDVEFIDILKTTENEAPEVDVNELPFDPAPEIKEAPVKQEAPKQEAAPVNQKPVAKVTRHRR